MKRTRIPSNADCLFHGLTPRASSLVISEPKNAVDILVSYLKGENCESLVVLTLDWRRRVRGIHTVSMRSVATHPRNVFKPALLSDASAMIVGRNRLNDIATPSPEDIQLAMNLVKIGEVLDIPILDHILLGEEEAYVSLARLGIVPVLLKELIPQYGVRHENQCIEAT